MNYPLVYAVKHKDLDIRMESRSGGIFTALSDAVLSSGGIVYGCILDENYSAVHVRAESIDERNKMRGSKYIQSVMGDVFSQVRKDLSDGKKVLFSGTSCQIAGLKAFLGEEQPQLVCVDIVCHGVPSPLVWHKYLEWQESLHGKCVNVDFRNKKDFGWAAHVETLTFKKKDGSTDKCSSRVFKTIFYSHNALRPCCYKCPYKSILHPADITIADYWGIEKASPGFSDNKGVSLVLINNLAGKEIFDSVSDSIELRECRIEDSMQPPLKAPFPAPSSREKFWNDLNTKPFSKIADIYGKPGFFQRLKKSLSVRTAKLKRKIGL